MMLGTCRSRHPFPIVARFHDDMCSGFEIEQYVIPFPTHRDPLDGYKSVQHMDLLQLRRSIAQGLARLDAS